MKAEEYLIYLKALKNFEDDKAAFEEKINTKVIGLLQKAMPQLIQELRAYQGAPQIPQNKIYNILNKIVGDDLRETYLEILQEIYVFGENKTIDKYNELTGESKPHIKFDMFKPDPNVLKLLREHAFQASESTMIRVTGNVMRSLAESYEEGWGIDQATEDLKKETTGMRDWELTRIARTETNGAQNEGSFDSMKELGVDFHKWITARDERVRPSSIGPDGKHRSKRDRKSRDGKRTGNHRIGNHRILDNEIVRLGDPFSNGLIRPGDRSGPMDEWISCRCTTVPYILPLGKTPPPGKVQFRESDLIEGVYESGESYIDIGTGLDEHVKNGDWNNQLKGMDKTKLNTLLDYQDEGYKDINYYLRFGTFPEDSIQASIHGEKDYSKTIEKQITDLTSLINKSETDTNLILYCGVPDSNNIKLGGTEGDDAFRSTSTDLEEAKGYCDESKTIWEIIYPKGSKGLPVSAALEENGLTSLHSENEILILPGFRGKVINIYEREGYNIIRLKPLGDS